MIVFSSVSHGYLIDEALWLTMMDHEWINISCFWFLFPLSLLSLYFHEVLLFFWKNKSNFPFKLLMGLRQNCFILKVHLLNNRAGAPQGEDQVEMVRTHFSPETVSWSAAHWPLGRLDVMVLVLHQTRYKSTEGDLRPEDPRATRRTRHEDREPRSAAGSISPRLLFLLWLIFDETNCYCVFLFQL